MRRLIVPLALAALCLMGCQIAPDTTPVAAGVSADPTPSTSPPDAVGASASPTPTPSPTSTPSPPASPDLRTKSTCSVAAGKFPKMTKGVRFTADIAVVNRGNIGATAKLKATWIGSALVHRAKTISIGYGKTVKVTFNAPTSATGATAFRAKGANRCEVTVKLLSYLGKPRPAK